MSPRNDGGKSGRLQFQTLFDPIQPGLDPIDAPRQNSEMGCHRGRQADNSGFDSGHAQLDLAQIVTDPLNASVHTTQIAQDYVVEIA
jgi:hypothetical protein